jgi:hypothetical protein
MSRGGKRRGEEEEGRRRGSGDWTSGGDDISELVHSDGTNVSATFEQ